MEINKYEIIEGDTLNVIAQQLGLSNSSLKDFHNKNSKPHEWIKEDFTVPSWVKELFIPDSTENLKKRKHKQESVDCIRLVQGEFDKTYNIVQNIDLHVAGNSMIDSETNIIWEIKKSKVDQQFKVEIHQKQHNIKYIKSMYRQLAEYMQKFNRPLKKIAIALNLDGSINSILNQPEIETQWKILRSELESEMNGSLEEKNLLVGGDSDFSQSLLFVKNNILYKLFFTKLFNEYNEIGKFIPIEPQTYISQIFSNEEVNISTKRKIEKEGDIIKIKFYSVGEQIKNLHLEKIYNNNLKNFFRQDCNYVLNWSLEYHFNKEGVMIFCQSKINECVNDQYSYVMKHIIKNINKK